MPFISLFHGKLLQPYIDEFKARLTFPIVTPDGFTIECDDLDETARHICCGGDKKKPVEIGRAQRILWVTEIFGNADIRKVIIQQPNNNVIFFCEQKKFIVICSEPVKGSRMLKLISAHPISGNKFVSFRELKKPHKLY